MQGYLLFGYISRCLFYSSDYSKNDAKYCQIDINLHLYLLIFKRLPVRTKGVGFENTTLQSPKLMETAYGLSYL